MEAASFADMKSFPIRVLGLCPSLSGAILMFMGVFHEASKKIRQGLKELAA